MPLHLPTPPAAVVRVVRAALESPTARHAARIPGLRVPPSRLMADQPMQIHRLDLTPRPARPGTPGGSAVPDLFRASRPVGWRFTVRVDGEPVAAAETMDTPDGAAFRQFGTGPFIGAALRALGQARLLPEVRSATYEPRLLSVPDLYMMALWLHRTGRGESAAAPGTDDLLVPLAPAPPGFVAHRAHRVDELLPVLAGRAALRMLAGTS